MGVCSNESKYSENEFKKLFNELGEGSSSRVPLI
jgi:hypothetical protein